MTEPLAADMGREPPPPPFRLLLSGSSGLVGSILRQALASSGHTVVPLLRHPPSNPASPSVHWDFSPDRTPWERLEGFDVMIHLGGAGISDRRWTPTYRKTILESRIVPTRELAEAAARLRHPPALLLVASATGFYGNRPWPEVVDEDSPPGEGFLSEVVRQWEAAAAPAGEAGIRVVHLRLGMVLSRQGGALARMLSAFRSGLGGPLGSGRQPLSWVSGKELPSIVQHVMSHSSLHGPVNAVSPEPLPQRDFARALGRALHRPAFLPLPGWCVKLLFGEMGRALLLGGARVEPRRLLGSGYRFHFPTLKAALETELSPS